eukprot:jgi/Botrbrau1/22762/Bobra.0132s0093.2
MDGRGHVPGQGDRTVTMMHGGYNDGQQGFGGPGQRHDQHRGGRFNPQRGRGFPAPPPGPPPVHWGGQGPFPMDGLPPPEHVMGVSMQAPPMPPFPNPGGFGGLPQQMPMTNLPWPAEVPVPPTSFHSPMPVGGRGTPSTIPQRKQRDEVQEERKRVMRTARVQDTLKGIPILEEVAGPEIHSRYQRAMAAGPSDSVGPITPADSAKVESLYMWPVAAGRDFLNNAHLNETSSDMLTEKPYVVQGFQDCLSEIHRQDKQLIESKVGTFATPFFLW